MDKEIRQMTMKPLLRSDEAGGDMVVEGYAAVFESPTVLYESEYSGYQYLEQIARSAFDRADMSRTVFKYNHGDNALVLARTSNDTLKLEADEHGLKVTATLAETTAGLSSGAHMTVASVPGRPFFMSTGVNDTSFAPAAKMRFDAYDSSSPVISSTLNSSSHTVPSEAAQCMRSPRRARTTFARSKSFAPAP